MIIAQARQKTKIGSKARSTEKEIAETNGRYKGMSAGRNERM